MIPTWLINTAVTYGFKYVAKKLISHETKPLRELNLPTVHPWLNIALKELGVSEIAGRRHNVSILRYHLYTTLKATSDEIAWCSSFMCYCMENAGIVSTRSALARSWLAWGIPVARPERGCVVILKRGRSTTYGHVGLYMGESGKYINVLGGNQDDSVCIKRYRKDKVIGYRLPGA